MNKLNLIFLPFTITAAVFAFTLSPWSFELDRAPVQEALRSAASETVDPQPQTYRPLLTYDSVLTQQEAEYLWQNALFHPDRTSDGGDSGVVAANDKNATDYDFELSGCVVMNNKGSAIIYVTSKGRRRSVQVRTSKEGGPITRRPKRYYKVGEFLLEGAERINTGYRLIKVEKSRAHIQKGSSAPIILEIDHTDKGSEQRKEAINKEEVKPQVSPPKVVEAEKQVAKEEEKKLQPPPPPPPPPAARLNDLRKMLNK